MKSIMHGFFMNACQLQNNGSYSLVRGGADRLKIHSSSILHGEGLPWVLFVSAVQTDRQYLHYCTAVNPKSLLDIAPHYFKLHIGRK